MANIQKILQFHPEMADFRHNQQLIGLRGDVLSYWANTRTDSFSIDESGFRHSTFQGKDYSVADCLRNDRYGIVLGPSSLFGFGVAGNENCMASLLAERFGFPFANAVMPGANSRNLNSLLVGLLVSAPRPPAVVVHSSGGDLVNFCESSLADPIFGSPNRSQLKAGEKSATAPDPDQNFPRAVTFNALWTSAAATVCRAYGTGLVGIHQSTFFDKVTPSAVELECALGKPSSPRQQRQFANLRRFSQPFFVKRKETADRLGIPLAGWGLTEQLGFLDEFHCDRASIGLLSHAVGDAVEPLLKRASAGGKKGK